MVVQTTKIKDGKIILPKEIQRSWSREKAFVFSNKDTIVIKKIKKPLSPISNLASRVSSPKMTSEEIQKEIQDYQEEKSSTRNNYIGDEN